MIRSSDDRKGDDAFKKALLLLSREGLDGAAMIVDRELENDPESWEAWSAKADIFYFQKHYNNAMICCEKSLCINPNNALACNTKGNILYMLGRYKEAIGCYNKAIESEPLFIRAWYNKRMASEIQLNKSAIRVHYFAPRDNIDKRR
ncbi:MAG TPA: tetratricopeptide repeat protein [Methanothrix sp.]